MRVVAPNFENQRLRAPASGWLWEVPTSVFAGGGSSPVSLLTRAAYRVRGVRSRTLAPPEDVGHHGETVVLLCEDRTAHTAHRIMIVCELFSVSILCLFLVELLLKMWVAPAHFRQSRLHRLDISVVVLSLLADIVGLVLVYLKVDLEVKLFEGVLVMIRLWRIMRIFHTAFIMWHRSTSPLKLKVKLQRKQLERALDNVGMLKTLLGMSGNLTNEKLRGMVNEMQDQNRRSPRSTSSKSPRSPRQKWSIETTGAGAAQSEPVHSGHRDPGTDTPGEGGRDDARAAETTAPEDVDRTTEQPDLGRSSAAD